MGIFRSHLFPHLIYLAGLTIVCVIGLKNLMVAQDEFADLKRIRQNAVELIDPTVDPVTGESSNPLKRISEQGIETRETFLQMTNRRAYYALEGIEGAGVEALEIDAAALKKRLKKIHRDIIVLLPQVELLDPTLANSLRGTNRSFTQGLEDEGAEFFYTMQGLQCDEKLYQIINLLDERIYSKALSDVKRSSEQQDIIFERLKSRLSYTLIWLIVLSATYLYAVNTLLARPVKRLAEIARTVTAGKLLVRAEISTGGGPVAELCDDFNRMVDMLVESLDEQQKAFSKLKSRTDDLQAANEHKNRFIANISHELKTPLNAIIGFADILMTAHHGPLSERQMEYLDRIFNAGKHLLAMICDLIDVMKLDLNALQLKSETFDIKKTTTDVGDLLMPQIDENKHNFTTVIDDGLPEATMDLTRYRQILMNLLSNAIKFTPDEGKITLKLGVENETFVLEVTDNGIGISKKDRHRIFQDFIQLDSKLHRKHEGTGIGLALTRRLVDLMGGELEVKSEVDNGSTFTVTLPVTYEPSLAKVQAKEKRPAFTRKMSPVNTISSKYRER